jgi:hypothetical protein
LRRKGTTLAFVARLAVDNARQMLDHYRSFRKR